MSKGKSKGVEANAVAKQEEKDRAAIAEIAAGCPLVEVQGEYSHARSQWRIRGLRNGEAVIDVKGQFLKTSRDKFYSAYATAKACGMLGPAK